MVCHDSEMSAVKVCVESLGLAVPHLHHLPGSASIQAYRFFLSEDFYSCFRLFCLVILFVCFSRKGRLFCFFVFVFLRGLFFLFASVSGEGCFCKCGLKSIDACFSRPQR